MILDFGLNLAFHLDFRTAAVDPADFMDEAVVFAIDVFEVDGGQQRPLFLKKGDHRRPVSLHAVRSRHDLWF